MKITNAEWKKRLTAGLLAIAMLCGVMPPAVMAEDTENLLVEVTDEENVEEKQKNEKETPSPEEDPGGGEEESEEGAEKKQEEEEEQEPLLNMPMLLTEDSEVDGEEQLAAQEGEPTAQTIPTTPTLELARSGLEVSTDGEITTITVKNSDDLIKLSNVLPNEYCDKTIQLSPTSGQNWNLGGDTNDGYTFLGLGGKGQDDQVYPFSGELKNTEENYSILTTHPLFNNLSTDATLATLQMGSLSYTDEEGQTITSTAPLLAGTVTDGHNSVLNEWSIKLVGDNSFGGLIGTLESGTVKLTVVEGSAALSCAPTGHAGLFCNTMKAGTTLTAVNSATGITVNATGTTTDADGNTVSSDAGGFVGRMEDGATLTASGKSVASVTSEQGNAGGIVGSAENANITVSGTGSGNITANASKNAGGIVGDYVNFTQSATLDLSNYTTNVTISGGSNAGGVFGELSNRGTFIIQGKEGDFSQTDVNTYRVQSQLSDGSGTPSAYGGLLGTYTAEILENTLILQNLSVKSVSADVPTAYGGVIGTLSSTSYVEINKLTVDTKNTASKFGGLVGSMGETSAVMLNVGDVTLSCLYHAIEGDDRGGLIGYLANGVVRLHGTTDLSNQKMTTSGAKQGQIVGENGNGLVYAVGDGDGKYGEGEGWTLKRYTSPIASDIGNWGQVVRLDGSKLKETTDGSDTDASNLFYFNDTEHTVKVLGNPTNSFTIISVRDFAAYALAYDFISDQGSPAPVLIGIDGVNSATDQNIIVSPADSSNIIDLTGIGILGIGRDNGGFNADAVYFTGSITGTNSPTIKLDIGSSTFGTSGSSPTEPKGYGGLQAYTGAHNFLGLLSVAGSSTTISGLQIDGSVTAYGCDNKTKRMAAAVAYGKRNITFENVIVSATLTAKGTNGQFYQAGFIGDEVDGSSDSLLLDNCTWRGSLNNTVKDSYLGGLIAYVKQGKKTITVKNCILSGTINANNADWQDVHMGGLIAEFQGGDGTELNISGLSVTDANIGATTATKTCGGLLGYSWPNTNVTFGIKNNEGTTTGVTISGSTLNANNAKFGGLVYQATGYWDATAANSVVFNGTNSITGKSETNNPSGLLVGTGLIGGNALYLEVGTWGSGGAYYVEPDSVTLTLGGSTATSDSYFDELVGETIADNKGHNNAVVSLATPGHALIDDTTCNTYTGQIDNFQNGKTRYYYNLDSYREGVNASNLASPGAVLCWSVSQYAAGNIKGYFCSGDNATISGTIDLTGYSYYPVSPLGSVSITGANLTFAKETITEAETGAIPATADGQSASDNKTPDDPKHQHYMMHYGLLYDVSNSVRVTGSTSFDGTVGKDGDGSGALIFGTVTGNPNNPVEISLQGITLNGLRVSGNLGDYAPLLINKNVNGGMKLTVDNLCTGAGYSADTPAATSLIGKIGGPDATKLTLEFKNIALDGRKEADSTGSTSVNNNGTHPVSYNTTKTIFTNATLLESFQYLSDSTGVYNFNSDDEMVTYGYEISDSQKNPGEQYRYYDTDELVWDGITGDDNPTAEEIKEYYKTYLPYVASGEVAEGKYHELDVNLRLVHLNVGCGTYRHPYEITDGKQLEILANYLATGKAYNWVVQVNRGVYTAQCDTDTAHDYDGDNYYLCDGETWYPAEKYGDKFEKDTEPGRETVNKAGMYAYLRNAYYQIDEDITISSSTYMGIGGDVTSGDGANAFSGTILGKADQIGIYPTVYISSQITDAKSFGGLVCYSQGSVIKNLTVSYAGNGEDGDSKIDGASIGMTNYAVPGTYNADDTLNNPFFGGVVGYCMGGDTIIDNVSVNYGESSVTLSGTDGKDRLIAAGGYVGLVGGARKATENSDYEKAGGGVVFRTAVSTQSASCPNSAAQDGSAYFYCNPYVGRVLDGYACAEDITVDNTDKNYQISKLDSKEKTGLSVNGTEVTVSTKQGLWLLSAIVNSGAGAMNASNIYQDVDNNYVDAYQYGKPRSGKFDDETYWGGVKKEDQGRVSYLIQFTNSDAAKLTGMKSGDASKNNPVSLTFSQEKINMTSYGNGFRGIGASYGVKGSSNKNCRRSLLIGGIQGTDSCTTITLGMEQHDYQYEYEQNAWANQGAGLFTVLNYSATNTAPCVVENLKLSGKVGVLMYDKNGTEQGVEKKNFDVGVGAFASRTAYSSNQLKFTNFHLSGMDVTGGTSTGGVIGLNQDSGELSFEEWTFTKVTVYKWVYNDGSTGGFVGWHNSGKTLTIKGYGAPTGENSRQWNVDTLNVTVKADKKAYGNVGGLTGANDNSSTVLIDGVNALKLTVTGTAAREVGGLADGGVKTEIKNCWLQDITVSGNASTRLDIGTSDRQNGPVGGILGYNNNGSSVIENVTITGKSSVTSESTANEAHVGGLVGYVQQSITIKDCSVTGTQDQPIQIYHSGSNRVGGLVGRNNSTLKINNCTVENVNLLADNSAAGGLIGKTEGSKSINISNVTLSNVIAATKNRDIYTGLLMGNGNNNTISGYNILAKGCKAGRVNDSNATVGTLGAVEADNWVFGKSGLWIGNATGTIKLVAVATDDTSSPQKDYSAGGTTTSITYADYPVVQTNTSGSASPYLDVNPEGTLTLGGTTYTGNGVGYLDGGATLQNSIPYTILSEAAKTETSRHYYNVIDSDDFTFSDIVSKDNDNVNKQKNIRLRTFAEYLDKEEKQTPTVALSTAGDFPVLVVDNLGGSKVTAAIWNYIAALTNVSSGAEARNQTTKVTPTTYQWNTQTNKFEAAESTTMKSSGNGFFCSSNAYDNGKMQFTLLDVKYANPTDDKHTGFHLYVPVLVKKIMDAKVNVSILAGTSYLSDDYDANTALYATAGFDEPVTAYITYNYSRSEEEWQSALNDGSNLLWYYKKTLNLIGDGTPLPTETKLTLVNAQSGQMYYHEIQSNEVDKPVQTAYKLEEHFVNSSGQQFVSSRICDLLGITATVATEESQNRYVVTGVEDDAATVRIGSTYYRPYDRAKDTEIAENETYCLTVGDGVVGNEDGYLSTPEGYYLTIQIPKMDKAVNNTLFIENEQSLTQSQNALPVRVKDNLSDGNDARHYVIYDGLNTPTISTVIRHYNKNGEEVNSLEMQNGDSIVVQLESEISLTADGVSYYKQGYAPAELYHQFLLSMRKKDENSVVSASLIGAEDIHWTYTIDGETIGSGTEHPRDLDVLTLKFGTKETHLIEKLRDSEGHSVTVGATITLRYGNNVSAVFPERAADDPTSGLYVHTESRVAADSNLLPTTGVKDKKDETDGFFCSSPSNATMSYDAIEKYGTDGKTLQLGINPLDRYSVGIRAEGIYDYSAVSETTLGKADTIRYTLELFQKGENGEYVQVSGGKISSYLPVPKLVTNLSDGTEEVKFDLSGNSYQLVHKFARADSGNEIIVMDLEPRTGSELEDEAVQGWYANYRVRLTAVMLDESRTPLSDTLASDYIVYTNAKILQKLVSSSEQNENT